VPLRYRSDGLTPETQRAFVEALADCGLIHVAAARVGVSPQAVNRTRRRADARGFDLACTAARRFGARRLHDTAWERAIEGSIRRHYYHGELKSEERVYDNKLLIYLLGKTEHLLDEPPEAAAVAANWEPWVEAMEHGTPLPDVRSAWQKEQDERLAEYAAEAEAEEADDDEDEPGEDEIWEDDGVWLTSFPPPADFDGVEDGVPGEEGYSRSLTEAEEAAMDASGADENGELAEAIMDGCVRRDRYFGFEGGLDVTSLDDQLLGAVKQAGEGRFFFAREAEPSETSAPLASNPELDSEPAPDPIRGSIFPSPRAPNPERDSEPAPDLIRGSISAESEAPDAPGSEAEAQPGAAVDAPTGADHYEAAWLRAPGGPLWTGTAEELEAAARGEEPAQEPSPEEEYRSRIWRL